MRNRYLSQVDAIRARTDAETDKVIDAVRADLLIPFCERTGLRFTSGMGSWSFDKRDRYGVRQYYGAGDAIPGRIPRMLIDFLGELSVVCNNDLGSLMQGYTPSTYGG